MIVIILKVSFTNRGVYFLHLYNKLTMIDVILILVSIIAMCILGYTIYYLYKYMGRRIKGVNSSISSYDTEQNEQNDQNEPNYQNEQNDQNDQNDQKQRQQKQQKQQKQQQRQQQQQQTVKNKIDAVYRLITYDAVNEDLIRNGYWDVIIKRTYKITYRKLNELFNEQFKSNDEFKSNEQFNDDIMITKKDFKDIVYMNETVNDLEIALHKINDDQIINMVKQVHQERTGLPGYKITMKNFIYIHFLLTELEMRMAVLTYEPVIVNKEGIDENLSNDRIRKLTEMIFEDYKSGIMIYLPHDKFRQVVKQTWLRYELTKNLEPGTMFKRVINLSFLSLIVHSNIINSILSICG